MSGIYDSGKQFIFGEDYRNANILARYIIDCIINN